MLKWKRVLSHRSAVVGGIFVGMVVIIAIFAPYIAPYDPYQMNSRSMLSAPNRSHLCGTDAYGRDVFSRVVYGSRISLHVGLLVALCSSILGTLIGLGAGYFGKIDNFVMRLMDALMAVPALLLAIVLMAVFGASTNNAILVLTIVYTPRTSRVIRSSVLSIREKPYIEAARAISAGTLRMIFRHILPNAISPLIVQATLVVSYAIISEVSLSFIGVGAPPPTPSWGNILSGSRNFLQEAPWISVFPRLAIVLLVIGVNVLGDAFRDLLSPRFRTIGRHKT